MTTATLRSIPIAALVLALAIPAAAQHDVTFQVDMSAAIDKCALTDDSVISVPGSFNDWSPGASVLSHQGDGIYAGTFAIAEGPIEYKFHGTPDARIGWEDGDNRQHNVTGAVTLDVVPFNKTLLDFCDGVEYTINFEVDMSIAILQGRFDPDTDDVFVAGELFGWGPGEDNEMFLDPFNEDDWIYTGSIVLTIAPPALENPYKFIIRDDNDVITWEGGDNRLFDITGDEPGQVVQVPRRYFDDVSPDDILLEDAIVRIEVDLRPAYYYIMDHGQMPPDVQSPGGSDVTSIEGLWLNGPFASRAAGDTADSDWIWGEALTQIDSRRLFDDGSHGDQVAGDSVYTRINTYSALTATRMVGKTGVNGFDNEAGVGVDHHFEISEGASVYSRIFGCIRMSNGNFTARFSNDPNHAFYRAYQEYLLIDNTVSPATCQVVRSGGGVVSVEPTGKTPEGLALHGNFPNPVSAGRTTFEYSLPTASHVRLEVFDLMGRRVAVVVDDMQQAETYRVSFDASSLSSGIYIYRLVAGQNVLTQRMTVVR